MQVLDEVKSVIAQNIAGGIENDCITIKGFIFLHCLFIQRGRNETTWTVLRNFGYDESLELTHSYLYAKYETFLIFVLFVLLFYMYSHNIKLKFFQHKGASRLYFRVIL